MIIIIIQLQMVNIFKTTLMEILIHPGNTDMIYTLKPNLIKKKIYTINLDFEGKKTITISYIDLQ